MVATVSTVASLLPTYQSAARARPAGSPANCRRRGLDVWIILTVVLPIWIEREDALVWYTGERGAWWVSPRRLAASAPWIWIVSLAMVLLCWLNQSRCVGEPGVLTCSLRWVLIEQTLGKSLVIACDRQSTLACPGSFATIADYIQHERLSWGSRSISQSLTRSAETVS